MLRAMRLFLPLTAILLPARLLACDLALVLAVDVSGSVDREEYTIQMEGLAAALRDGIVVDALVDQNAQVSLVQWSGSSRQVQSIKWRGIETAQDVSALAAQVSRVPRVWRNYSTAIGEALSISARSFDMVADCGRRVIDVSGDGVSNEGIPPEQMRPVLRAGDITVNALAIETDDTDLTGYFFEQVIDGPHAFVVTANGFEDYPAQILRKLQRETTKQLSRLNLNDD
ncbi:Von Willebrand factor type A domain protein [Sulfitobacter noctilucicola]|uniref:Ca-activated chloride channel family protein n=2 Tax=Sulfitobacter noctilucicola TaxID=1342301 RepID=A0A7W6M993_9RHOB|nr:Von Willebrand factor type A domain protein [Sulfitobacter noctilucicola]MBB4174808.1 Ca-activated chloride channel family protein [Sulfitobacter noctilucicola]